MIMLLEYLSRWKCNWFTRELETKLGSCEVLMMKDQWTKQGFTLCMGWRWWTRWWWSYEVNADGTSTSEKSITLMMSILRIICDLLWPTLSQSALSIVENEQAMRSLNGDDQLVSQWDGCKEMSLFGFHSFHGNFLRVCLSIEHTSLLWSSSWIKIYAYKIDSNTSSEKILYQ